MSQETLLSSPHRSLKTEASDDERNQAGIKKVKNNKVAGLDGKWIKQEDIIVLAIKTIDHIWKTTEWP